MSIWGNFLIASHSASTVRSRSIFSSVSFPFGAQVLLLHTCLSLCWYCVTVYPYRCRFAIVSYRVFIGCISGSECLDVSSRAWPLVLPLWPRKATVSRAQPWLSAALPPSAMLGDCKDSCTHSHLFASELAKVLIKSWKTCWENTGDHLCCLLIKHIFAWQVMQGACDIMWPWTSARGVSKDFDKTPQQKLSKYYQILLADTSSSKLSGSDLEWPGWYRGMAAQIPIPSASIGHPISWTSSKHGWIWVYRHGVRLGSRN